MISNEEYGLRMASLQQQVAASDLDAYIVTNEENIYYLTGVSYKQQERPFFIIVRPEPPVVLLTPALEGEHLGNAPNIDQVIWYWDYPSPLGEGWSEKLNDILDSTMAIGVEPSLKLEIVEALSEHEYRILPLVEDIRLVKSAAEIEMIQTAARFCDMGAGKILEAAYPGITLLEIASLSRSVQLAIIKQVGYDPLATNLMMAAWPAPLSAQPHGVPAIGDQFRAGPHIWLSYLRVNGYAAENERTFFLKPPTAQVKEAFAAMTEARKRAFAAVRPGVAAVEVDLAAKEFLRREGFGDYLLHRTGHGVGQDNHEGPWIAEGSDQVLAENMVITIEPGIYLPDVGGVRHSDTVLVTQDGYRLLTNFPTDIKSLTVKGAKPMKRIMGKIIRKVAGIG